jgi:tetraacyldisaccharide 4'-kinase
MKSLEQAWQQGRFPRPVLAVLALAYGWGQAMHRWLQTRSAPVILPVPVISIGNVAVGGTGKTPLAAEVGRRLSAKGLKVFFLSRGYGRHSRSSVVFDPQQGLLPPWEETGDEPRVLCSLVPGAAAVIDANRLRGARLAMDLGAQALVLDDGFQRRHQLARDLDLVAVQGSDPGAGNALLPLGRLREPLRAVREAHAVVRTGMAADFQAALPDAFAGLPMFKAVVKPKALVAWGSVKAPGLSKLKGMKIAAFCGLARPQGFEKTLLSLGAKLLFMHCLADHQAMNQAALSDLMEQAQQAGAKALVCTHKDLVKLPAPFKMKLEVWALTIGLDLQPSQTFDALLKKAVSRRFRG